MNGTTQFQDPVLAYDRLAKDYAELAKKRVHYLAGVEREVLSRVPRGSSSLLDIGAGDGSRALRIASAARISRIVLAEPSGKMLSLAPNGATVWRDRAEDLGSRRSSETFDVITCLWNVLGHVRGESRACEHLTTYAVCHHVCRPPQAGGRESRSRPPFTGEQRASRSRR